MKKYLPKTLFKFYEQIQYFDFYRINHKSFYLSSNQFYDLVEGAVVLQKIYTNF